MVGVMDKFLTHHPMCMYATEHIWEESLATFTGLGLLWLVLLLLV